MNKGLLNRDLLEKDIEQLVFYTKEEKTILVKIYQKLEEITSNYNSTNTALFLSNISNSKNIIDKIYEKRNQYINILKKEIIKYNRLSNQATQVFNREGNL